MLSSVRAWDIEISGTGRYLGSLPTQSILRFYDSVFVQETTAIGRQAGRQVGRELSKSFKHT